MKLGVWMSVAMLAVACSGEEKATPTGDTATTMSTTMSMGTITEADLAIAEQLWADIAGYEQWSVPPGWSTTPELSGSHMGNYVVTYWNTPLAGWDLTGSAPDDAIGVKDGFADEAGATLDNITVMSKQPGYDPANGDWFYAQYAPDGTPMAGGAVGMCVGCHAGAPTDYIFSDPPVEM